MPRLTSERDWSVEEPDPSVGIFGEPEWFHEDHPELNDLIYPYEAAVELITAERPTPHVSGVRDYLTVYKCPYCSAVVFVKLQDMDPDFPFDSPSNNPDNSNQGGNS